MPMGAHADLSGDGLHGALLLGGDGRLGQFCCAQDVLVPIPGEVGEEKDQQGQKGGAQEQAGPPQAHAQPPGKGPAQPARHGEELHRQAHRRLDEARQAVLRGVPHAPAQPGQLQQAQHHDEDLQDPLCPLAAAGEGIDGHGRHLAQEDRGAVAQEDHRHGPHGDVVQVVEPAVLVEEEDPHQQHGADLPEEPIEQRPGPADRGGEDQVHVRQGEDGAPLGKPVPHHVEEDEQEEGGGHGHHFPGIPIGLRGRAALAAPHRQHEKGHQEHHVDQPGGLAEQVPDGVLQPGEGEIDQGTGHASCPPSVMAKKRSSRLWAWSSSGRLYWVAAKRPLTMMWVTSQ